jgi:hypothetical protein
MPEKKLSLTKQEIDKITSIIAASRVQEEILNCINVAFRAYVTEEVFARLGIEKEKFNLANINLQEGAVIIKEEEKEKKGK